MDEIGGTRKLNVDPSPAPSRSRPSRALHARARALADAATLTPVPSDLGWDKFPQAESIVWFARGIGAARSGNVADAQKSLARIERSRRVEGGQNTYWPSRVTSNGSRCGLDARAEGKNEEAVALMAPRLWPTPRSELPYRDAAGQSIEQARMIPLE